MNAMKTVHGRPIPSSPNELLEPKKCALLVIDVQNDFLAEDGHYARHGRHVAPMRRILSCVHELIDAARASGSRVVFIQQSTLPGGASDTDAWLYFKTRDGKSPNYTLAGTWGEELFELQPREGEPRIRKFRPSAFHGTELADLLRGMGVETVVTCGVLTQGCVLATTLDASFHDFYAVVARDAVAGPSEELHEVALTFLASRYDCLSNEAILDAWSSGPDR
jgi:ureidoacrylate peracid hydrolase